ncbi:LuxR C-terminal-related transcriptional regulator [Nocardia sp. NPDC004260]
MDDRRRGSSSSVPAPLPGFVNRDREREAIKTLLLGTARLITLTGPGGIGKTRLAAETVRRFKKTGAGRTRVYWVRMARLTKNADQTAVEEEIAHAVIDSDFSNRSAWDALVGSLIGGEAGQCDHTILVIDNCEHVLTSVAGAVSELLEAIPELTIVATSREPLRWVGEHVIRVPPLTNRHALSFFLQRAELAGCSIVDADQTKIASEICRRVNNQPLYIQLAAARLMHQPAAMILHGLTGQADDTRLAWSHGPYGTDPRQRAVSDVIAWSYNLCSEKEQLLFDRLSVFASGYDTNPDDPDTLDAPLDVGADLDAIESICSDGDEATPDSAALRRGEVQGLLERLADHSLVSVHMSATSVRYSLAESLRAYAQRRLQQRSTGEMNEATVLAERHLRYYRDKIIYAAEHWATPEGQDQPDWALAAWANTVTAIETSLNVPGRAAAGLEICLGLIALRVPFATGSIRETRDWTERCLAATRASARPPIELQIGAMASIAWLALVQGRDRDAGQMLDRAVAECTTSTASGESWRFTAQRDIGLPAAVEFAWGLELLFVHRDADAITVLSRAHEKFISHQDRSGAAACELFMASAAALLGTPRQAAEVTRKYLDRASSSGTRRERSWAEYTRSIALTKHGDPTEALALQRSSLAYQLASGDQLTAFVVIQARMWSLARIIAMRHADSGRLAAVATEIAYLAGGTRTLRTRLGIALNLKALTDESQRAVVAARQLLGENAYAAAENKGLQLRPELQEVQRLALGTLTIDTSSALPGIANQPTSRWQDLSPAERQVAVLAAAGWSNAAIATRRGKSVRTIDAQVTAVLHKLVISSREDIIDHIPRSVIDQVRIESDRRPRPPGRKR